MTETEQQIWQQVCAGLKMRMSAAGYALFIPNLSLTRVVGREVTLAVESRFSQQELCKRWGPALREVFAEVLGHPAVFTWVLAESPINNINNNNLNPEKSINATSTHGFSPGAFKINNINRDYRGLKARINTDRDFVMVLDEWKVDEPFLYAACRDLGEAAVKGIIHRLSRIREGYFREAYGPIDQQRGRLFNKEIQTAKAKRKAG